ncbi:hypothetical protein P152DRAFT_475279 [Eremomyces bilateralis CBS 781.70]|uniref:Glycoside hydrolase 131 catalytic N-terminal domain-containing protein n=1 Tax=Eremomyces bilateralis CBS 781.70 TaxID=1392243 RepID=A0A6G1FYM6_9PEZI|nr:uncharacterized protein P152DRAFT_475279 [Eremomyces bilateralis CBS 781.70]KAF1810822.1 hypothetical protein P152DRAFT_475279 [Eremomyces bilateralis CBS 781.70]
MLTKHLLSQAIFGAVASAVGPFQYYIHGTGDLTNYVNLSPDFKNPADTASTQGVKITLDATAKWNSDMWQTGLIPQTKAAINSGRVGYHFSMKRTELNPPNAEYEHQVNFFESHFTKMKYGWVVHGEQGTSNPNLQWMIGGQGKWKTEFTPDAWYNFAYDIDFGTQTVDLYASTGADPLKVVVPPQSASTSLNGADWHLGVLRLPRGGSSDTAPEDWYFSGVYVESGEITTSISGPSA